MPFGFKKNSKKYKYRVIVYSTPTNTGEFAYGLRSIRKKYVTTIERSSIEDAEQTKRNLKNESSGFIVKIKKEKV